MARWTEKAAIARTRRRFDSIRKTLRTVEEDWGHETNMQCLAERIGDDLDEYMKHLDEVFPDG